MKKRKGDHFMDYADVVETACLTGPPSLAPYSGFARFDILEFKNIIQIVHCTFDPLQEIDQRIPLHNTGIY